LPVTRPLQLLLATYRQYNANSLTYTRSSAGNAISRHFNVLNLQEFKVLQREPWKNFEWSLIEPRKVVREFKRLPYVRNML